MRSLQVAAAGLAVVVVAGLMLAMHPEDEPPEPELSAAAAAEYARPPASFEQLLMRSTSTRLDNGDGHALIARSTKTSVSVPDRLSRRIVLTAAAGTTGVRPVAGDLTGLTAASGVAVYRHAYRGTDLAANILDPAAVRIFYILTSPDAPERFPIAVDAPTGARLALANGGVVMVSGTGRPIGAASPPWAYDADGRVVPTRYSLSGNTLVLTVDHHGAGVTYPVVADPPFAVGSFGSFLGSQLLAGILQWTLIKAGGWAVNKAKNNGCLSLSTFPSCTLHPFSYSWKNPAKPSSPPPAAVTVPNVTGKRLPDAHDTLTRAGLTKIDYRDDTGRGRVVLQPDNWTVVGQSPAAGTRVAPGTGVTLRVRKPTDGRGESNGSSGAVPEVVCMNLQRAQDTLQEAGYEELASTDGLGRGRHQVVDRNWVVIGQSATPGSHPPPTTRIVLTAVKYGEPTGSSGCRS